MALKSVLFERNISWVNDSYENESEINFIERINRYLMGYSECQVQYIFNERGNIVRCVVTHQCNNKE